MPKLPTGNTVTQAPTTAYGRVGYGAPAVAAPAVEASLLEQALALHQRGQIRQAATLYKQLLEAEPENADAMHMLGLVELQTGNPRGGEELIRRAIELNPEFDAAYNNLGTALRTMGRPLEAVKAFERAIAINPQYVQAFRNLGNALQDLREYKRAIDCYKAALTIDPESAGIHNDLGNALKLMNRTSEAEGSYRAALRIEPEFAEAHNNLGALLGDLGIVPDALKAFQRAVELSPELPSAHAHLALALFRLERWDEAALAFERALELDADSPELHSDYGTTLRHLKRLGESLAHYERALALRPQFAEAENNLGAVLQDVGRRDKALAHFRAAVAIRPEFPEAWLNLVDEIQRHNLFDEWRSAIDTAIARVQEPDHRAALQINRSIAAWIAGDMDTCAAGIVAAREPVAKRSEFLKKLYLIAFHRFLGSLLVRRESDQGLYLPDADEDLHFVGDSHCLAPARTVVRMDGKSWRVIPHLVFGCKAWHLGGGASPPLLFAFSKVVADLPQGATMIVGLGEIDCRFDEGIAPYVLKKGLQLEYVVERTVSTYVDYVVHAAAARSISVIFYGVPAPNVDLSHADPESRRAFLECIRLYNAALEKHAARTGCRYLDVYGPTVGDNGESNRRYHIDFHHLGPQFLGMAIAKLET